MWCGGKRGLENVTSFIFGISSARNAVLPSPLLPTLTDGRRRHRTLSVRWEERAVDFQRHGHPRRRLCRGTKSGEGQGVFLRALLGRATLCGRRVIVHPCTRTEFLLPGLGHRPPVLCSIPCVGCIDGSLEHVAPRHVRRRRDGGFAASGSPHDHHRVRGNLYLKSISVPLRPGGGRRVCMPGQVRVG